jgi:hypothetical protein
VKGGSKGWFPHPFYYDRVKIIIFRDGIPFTNTEISGGTPFHPFDIQN